MLINLISGGQQGGGYPPQGPREMFIMQQQGQQVNPSFTCDSCYLTYIVLEKIVII